MPFDISNSSYLNNYNDYNISDAQKKVPEKEFNYPRKSIKELNPINGSNQTLFPPPYYIQRWGAFPQNYFILYNTKKGFNKKGGLFTELINKNIDKINVINRDIKNQIKLNKENKKGKTIKEMKYKKVTFETTRLKQTNLKYNSLTPSSSMKNLLISKKFKEMFYDKNNQNNLGNYNKFNLFKSINI